MVLPKHLILVVGVVILLSSNVTLYGSLVRLLDNFCNFKYPFLSLYNETAIIIEIRAGGAFGMWGWCYLKVLLVDITIWDENCLTIEGEIFFLKVCVTVI